MQSNIKQIIENLYLYPRYLLGNGYDQALDYINNIIPLEIHSFKSGTKALDWTIPEEWVIRDAWVKFDGKKILDYKKNKLCLAQGSIAFSGKMGVEEFKKHLRYSDSKPDSYSYDYILYDKDWRFTMPRNKIKEKASVLMENSAEIKDEWKDILEEGEYEVFIDSEYVPGEMKIGVHTIKGKTDKEILLFAHLDHPHQANDNLSAVAGLITMADKIKEAGFEHTIKLVFCPETIGSITYAAKLPIDKVEFMVALDCIGNDDTVLFQKTYEGTERINRCCQLALQGQGASYRAGQFRLLIGSDEYVFNDPQIGIPGIMLSRWSENGYTEYHTADDTPDIIKEDKIIEIQDVILKTIEIYEKDFIPTRHKGPLMRSKYGVQTPYKLMNRNLDYLWYDIDGKKYLSEIISPMGLSFDYAYDVIKDICK
jgi:aminopeptidase-like protein